MSSYLKFLQGERDTSPPPAVRGGTRKQPWPRTPSKSVDEKPPDSNGVSTPMPIVTPQIPPPITPIPVTRLSQGDPQDDPRYFPLPKERKRNSFDSSDDGFSSDDDFFGSKKQKNQQSVKTEPVEKDIDKEKEKDNKEKEKVKNKIKVPKPSGPPSEKKEKTKT